MKTKLFYGNIYPKGRFKPKAISPTAYIIAGLCSCAGNDILYEAIKRKRRKQVNEFRKAGWV